MTDLSHSRQRVWNLRPDLIAACKRNDGWSRKVTHVFHDGEFLVVVRPVPGVILHLAVKKMSPGTPEPTWREMQAIKDDLVGPDRIAIQVYPTRSRLVDQADAFHLFVLPPGSELGFGIHHLDGPI